MIVRKSNEKAYMASSLSPAACFQLLPSLPWLKGASIPTESIIALRSASPAGWLIKALRPMYRSWTKYLPSISIRLAAYPPPGASKHVH